MAKDEPSKKAFTHIWKACKEGDLDQVRILLREGQKVNEQTTTLRNTPLHIAAKHGHKLIALQLVNDNFADTTIINSYNESALDMTQVAANYFQHKISLKMNLVHQNKMKLKAQMSKAIKKKVNAEVCPNKKLVEVSEINLLLNKMA